MESEIIQNEICPSCNKAFTTTESELRWRKMSLLGKSLTERRSHRFECPDCAEISRVKNEENARLEYEAGRRMDRESRYFNDGFNGAMKCPSLFHNPNRSKSPCPAAYDKVTSWEFSDRGLILEGPTSTGKTFAIWALLQRLYIDEGLDFKAMTSGQFSREVVSVKMGKLDSDIGFDKWMQKLIRVPILFIDDIGKGRFTEAVEAEFFSVIDERAAEGNPVLLTTNMTPAELRARISKDRANPLIARIKRHCQHIQFTP